MSTLAKIVPIPKGTYDATATYNSLDIVRYDGVSYICCVDGTTGVTPTDGVTWKILAQDGYRIADIDIETMDAHPTTTGCWMQIKSTDSEGVAHTDYIGGTLYFTVDSVINANSTANFMFVNDYIAANSIPDVCYYATTTGLSPQSSFTGIEVVNISVDDGECSLGLQNTTNDDLRVRAHVYLK